MGEGDPLGGSGANLKGEEGERDIWGGVDWKKNKENASYIYLQIKELSENFNTTKLLYLLP